MRNSNRGLDLLAVGAVGVLGFFLVKALSKPSQSSTGARRALPKPRREFLPLFSVHGGDFRLGTTDNELPQGPWMTFDEAASKAQNFDVTADAVDGRACVLDVRSGERYSPYPAAAQQ